MAGEFAAARTVVEGTQERREQEEREKVAGRNWRMVANEQRRRAPTTKSLSCAAQFGQMSPINTLLSPLPRPPRMPPPPPLSFSSSVLRSFIITQKRRKKEVELQPKRTRCSQKM